MTSDIEPEDKKSWIPDWVAGPNGGNPAMNLLAAMFVVLFLIPPFLIFLDYNNSAGGGPLVFFAGGLCLLAAIGFGATVLYFLYKIANKK